jgi:regulatory protein
MAGTVSALKMQRNQRRVNVFLDGVFAFALETVLAAGLHLGQPLTEPDIAQLQSEDTMEEASRRCAGLIVRRPRSTTEIQRYLRQRRVPEDAAARVMQRLAQNHLLNDSAFAKTWVENRQELHPRSRRALRSELYAKGVVGEDADHALADVGDAAAALDAARRKARRWEAITEKREFLRKVLAFLAMRGFGYEDAREASETVWMELRTRENSNHEYEK